LQAERFQLDAFLALLKVSRNLALPPYFDLERQLAFLVELYEIGPELLVNIGQYF
jgi:hypothetical protein